MGENRIMEVVQRGILKKILIQRIFKRVIEKRYLIHKLQIASIYNTSFLYSVIF